MPDASEQTSQKVTRKARPSAFQAVLETTFVIAFILLAVWFYSTRAPAADYVPLIMVFLSAVAAIRGKSWDATRQRISRLSWREDPTGDMAILDLARSKATIGTLANTRLVPHSDRAKDTMAMIEDTRFFLITPHGTRVTTRGGAPHQGFRALYELFDFCVATGEAKISEARDTYIATLDAKTIHGRLLAPKCASTNSFDTGIRVSRRVSTIERTLSARNAGGQRDGVQHPASRWTVSRSGSVVNAAFR